MAVVSPSEHFIPLKRSDLEELLCQEKSLTDLERGAFHQFCRLIISINHFDFNQRLEELKTAYAPFDPDSDTKQVLRLSADEEQRRLNDLFSDFAWLLEKADFKHLSPQDLEPALHETSAWGVPIHVDFGAYERMAIFARGDVVQTRSFRRFRNFYRREEVKVPVYQRLVLILKFRGEHQLSKQADADSVYIKIFKDIPKIDIKMLLPSARVHITKFDQGKIGVSLLSGLAAALWKFILDIGQMIETLFQSGTLWAIAAGGIGYSYKSFYGYQQTKQRYRLNLTQSLYFQNLNNNAGVLFRLLDEAEEQQCREAFVAYFLLWRNADAQGWTASELDKAIESFLEQQAGVKVDFDIRETLLKLQKWKIIEKTGERFLAVPIQGALETLKCVWDNYFRTAKPQAVEIRK
jgi:hypothetical protein